MIRVIFGAVLGSVLGSVTLALLGFAVVETFGMSGLDDFVLFGGMMGWCAGLVAGAVAGGVATVRAELRDMGRADGREYRHREDDPR